MAEMVSYNTLYEETIGVSFSGMPLNEAKFEIIPKFKTDPKIKGLAEDLEKGQELIFNNGEIYDSKSLMVYNAAIDTSVSATTDILYLLSTGYATTAVGLSLGPLAAAGTSIVWHLFTRLTKYLVDRGNEKKLKDIGQHQISSINAIIPKLKGKEKKQAEELRYKIQSKIDEIDVKKKKEEK